MASAAVNMFRQVGNVLGTSVIGTVLVTRFADEMVGLSAPDPLAAQWLIRAFLALWYWPLKDADAEHQMVRRFLGPPYAVDATTRSHS